MREFRQLGNRCRARIADQSAAVVLGDQSRRTDGERAPSRRAPADPRSPNGDGFMLIAGARRLRAARSQAAPRSPRASSNSMTRQRMKRRSSRTCTGRDIHPLDEGVSYQRLVASGRTIEDVAVAIGKSKGYVYQRISLTRLVPKVQDLLARDVLPLIYALKIAVVPAEQQEEALAQCFRPLFRDEEARRDQLEPLAQLTAWVEKTVRLNPRSEDTSTCSCRRSRSKSSRPNRSATHRCSRSRRCTSTPTTDPKPILAKSWKPADGKDRCAHARPGVIVLGRRAGHVPAGLHRQEGVPEALGTSEACGLSDATPEARPSTPRPDSSRRKRGPSSALKRSGGGRNSVREPFGSSRSARPSSDGRRCCCDCCSRTSGIDDLFLDVLGKA